MNKATVAAAVIIFGLLAIGVYVLVTAPPPSYSLQSGAQLYSCETTITRTDVPIYTLLNGTQQVGQCANFEQVFEADAQPWQPSTTDLEIVIGIVLAAIIGLAVAIELLTRPKK